MSHGSLSPEYRFDPLRGRAVLISPERALRPVEEIAIKRTERSAPPENCPFCEGREDQTPPELFAIRTPNSAPNTPGWQVRIVPNHYPAVKTELPEFYRMPQSPLDQLFAHKQSGIGTHDVVIESPHHAERPSETTAEQTALLFEAYQARLRMIREEGICRQALVFKNSGIMAGASQPHAHSQIIATTVAPPELAIEWSMALAFWHQNGRDIFGAILEWEREQQVRFLWETDELAVFCPYASRFPYETWIVPKSEQPCFTDAPASTVREAGESIWKLLTALEQQFENLAFNYVIHSSAWENGSSGRAMSGGAVTYRWHIELFPRLVGIAGFEIGGGIYINPVTPESAAQRLREQLQLQPA